MRYASLANLHMQDERLTLQSIISNHFILGAHTFTKASIVVCLRYPY